MTDRETLYSGLSNAAWGYFFLHVDFNLNNITILPAFVGYLLLLSAIGKLSGERRDLALLRPLCLLLAAWSGAEWLFSWAGADPGGMLPAADLIIEVAALYFHFQFLTDMAALAEQHQPEGGDLDQRLRRRRTAYIVLSTVLSLFRHLPLGRFQEEGIVVMMVLLVVMLVVMLLIMGGLFELRRLFREEEAEQPDV